MLISVASSLTSVNDRDNEREYGLEDKVGVDLEGNDMTCRDWTEQWWKWLLGIEERDNPFVLTSPHLNTVERSMGNQPNKFQTNSMEKRGQSVWFFVVPPYGVEGLARTKVLPNWSVLCSPYNAIASPEFYPDCNLEDLLKEDLDGVYELYATLDGIRLNGCTVKPDGESFEVDLPVRNIFGGKAGKHHMVQHGHWVFLKPLPLGDHLLHLHGYSKNYQLDIRCHLLVQS